MAIFNAAQFGRSTKIQVTTRQVIKARTSRVSKKAMIHTIQ
jgi:hypothetical protein